MFRIRKLADDALPGDAASIERVCDLLARRFAGADPDELARLGQRMRDPLHAGYRTIVLVAERGDDRLVGCATLLHVPDHRFCYLDWIATEPGGRGGIGAALYERVREEAALVGAEGLYFECLPDDPELCREAADLTANRARLRFYERWGARPLVGTSYETPLRQGDDQPPLLVLDRLGRDDLPGARRLRAVVRVILERKYKGVCPPEYVETVVASITDRKFGLRPARYTKRNDPVAVAPRNPAGRIALFVNQGHEIHHVRERGYVEAPVRIKAILRELERLDVFERLEVQRAREERITAVHDPAYVGYLRRACHEIGDGAVYPYVFPIRNRARPPRSLPLRAGYYCLDTFTPLGSNAWKAARGAVDCAVAAAEEVLGGRRFAYALVRPPGHHAERGAFGGFCYFNNSAIAAERLATFGRVAVLDVDYHHGNGTQEIFYARGDVLTVSIHGHPSFAYPYFSGFAEEDGEGSGRGANVNFPLAESVTAEKWHRTLSRAVKHIERFDPAYLVVALGLDTAKGDPTGSWPLEADDFFEMGRRLAAIGRPTVVVQEGGYRTRSVGVHARRFFEGLSLPSPARAKRQTPRSSQDRTDVAWSDALEPGDDRRVGELLAACSVFRDAEIETGVELARLALAGADPDYRFIVARRADALAAYACWGPIPGAPGRHDLYWIATSPDERRGGLARRCLDQVEHAVRREGGQRLYVETSGRADYEPARRLYEGAGFKIVATLEDFYAPGDDKVVLMKNLAEARERNPKG
jgi:acetoin utilization deacetylase AcuC-like enzyme/ribosomal protein S18 acetylase RimI-like enzyme